MTFNVAIFAVGFDFIACRCSNFAKELGIGFTNNMPSGSFFKKLRGFMTQGATPSALAASSTVGLLLGLFPVLGVTSLMMGAISVRWRLNLPLMLALSYLIYPLQLLLLVPFVRVGEWVSGAVPAKLSLDSLGRAFEQDFLAALVDLGSANLQAVLGWCLLSLPFAVVLYLGLIPVFRYLLNRYHV
jgi:uncharacterized protein (DUF2062 family)